MPDDELQKIFCAGVKKNFPGIADAMIDKVDAYYKIISVDTAFAASKEM